MSHMIDELLHDSEALVLEPRRIFDQAIMGIASRADGLHVVAYDMEKCILALMEHYSFDREQAEEWFDFNTASAFSGPGTPLFIDLVN